MTVKHVPVLLKEVVESLNLSKGKFIVDGTIDGGGHAREIVAKIMPGGRFLGIDLDIDLLEKIKESFMKEFSGNECNVRVEWGNYKDMDYVLNQNHLGKPDGILLDLGFSSFHLDDSGRGFSFQKDERLDMRYDTTSGISAAEVVNSTDERVLADMIWKFGEEKFSRQIAKAIVQSRRKNRIETTLQLSEIISGGVPAFYRRGKINPATKTFQALRIYVNDELRNLAEFLQKVPEVIASGGRVSIISFHSLEDRMVKKAFADFKKEGLARIITKKPIVATREEVARNPRSRSAKLRVLEFI
jgi:16S rRNA (cytosine1402-N4)-methyltransferase